MLNDSGNVIVRGRLLICGFSVRFRGGSPQNPNNLSTFALGGSVPDAPGMQADARR
jgi:hypothetical protein